MLTRESAPGMRALEDEDDLAEVRLEAVGLVFHGIIPDGDSGVKRRAVKSGTNVLHFARCAKIDKAALTEAKVWFRTIRAAKAYLDEHVGLGRWSWCKICQRDITQRVLDEH